MAAQEMIGIFQELSLRTMEACMTSRMDITGRLIAAGRALVEVGREDFAKAAGLSVDTLALLEAGGSAWVQSQSDAKPSFERSTRSAL